MKIRIILLSLILFLIFSCGKKDEQTEKQTVNILKDTITNQKETIHRDSLVLNGGKKWKADENTNKHVKKIMELLRRYETKKKIDYNEFSQRMEDAFNLMLVECQMAGPERDALQKWLEPAMNANRKLVAEENADKKQLFEQISKQLKLYSEYFE